MGRPRIYPPVDTTCSWCGKEMTIVDPTACSNFRMRGRAYCTPEHGRLGMGKLIGDALRGRSSPSSSRRMTLDNPMSNPETREKVAETLRSIGARPSIRGGNGKPLPEPQRRLLEALGSEWVAEHAVGTGRGSRALGLPSHYKIDIANLRLMIAIEVDGSSHSAIARQEADHRKDVFLRSLGWTVVRFSNALVMSDLEACVGIVSIATQHV